MPFSLAGVALLLSAIGVPVGATVVIGLLVVVAAHVMEGVLLLTYAESARSTESVSAIQSVLTAVTTRFRPRLMTALGVIIGLSPIAMNMHEGGEMLQPMGRGGHRRNARNGSSCALPGSGALYGRHRTSRALVK